MPVKGIIKPNFKPEISFKPEVQEKVEQATILHCHISKASSIRIWPDTVLLQHDGIKKKLIQAYNIPEYPVYTRVHSGYVFTLVFEGLDKDCKEFDLIEDIPEPGGFVVKDIQRNKSDVYRITV
jgi:hypothetical protein